MQNDVSDPFFAVRAGLEGAKLLRVPLAPYEQKLSVAQKLFDQGDGEGASQALRDLAAELRALPEKEKAKPKISITFDAGAGAAPTPDLVRVLREKRIKITFFSTGKWAATNPQLFQNVLMPDAGLPNELGNHSVDHPHFVTGGLSDDAIKNEILDAETTFQNMGYHAKPLFRYPYGERNMHTDDIVKGLGYESIGWTVDSWGWKGTLSTNEVIDRVVSKVGPNGIVLMHVGSPEDVAALPTIIDRLQPNYQFVFVSEL